jgi:hypothetical protein
MARIATDELGSDVALGDNVPPDRDDSQRGDSSDLPGAIFLPNPIDRDELPPYEGQQPSEVYEPEFGGGIRPSSQAIVPGEESMSALPSANIRSLNQPADIKEKPTSNPQETSLEKPSQTSSF